MKIAIIGGGAAGMMSAATLAEGGFTGEIHLFDKNTGLGKKVLISGGGRCNVTTGLTDKKTIFSKYTRGADFLKEAFSVFSPMKVRAWFEEHGVPLKNEEDNRVFPISDDGGDIVGVFERIFSKGGVHMHLGEGIASLEKKDDIFHLSTKNSNYQFNALIIATGGNAYSHTGSAGDGYAFARNCGHTITALGPSLNSFETAEEWCHRLSGLSFQHARLRACLSDGSIKLATGPILFTHFGISGPATFALSSHLAFATISKDNPLKIEITPNADDMFDSLEKTFQARLAESPTKTFRNILGEIVPKRFADELLLLADIDGDKHAAQISREERREIVHLLTGRLSVTFLSRRAGDEFVTAGGVALTEVNKKTMESIICPNLYFGGEVLDIDGVTGGFNLQSSWATGRLAGLSILDKIKKSAS